MADNDWDSVTRIGSKVRTGGGGVNRERVIKGKSAINAASRSGAIVATEKKYASANSRGGVDGQHLAKIANSNDPIKPKTIGQDLAQVIRKRRNEMVPTMTQKDFAHKCQIPLSDIQKYENGSAIPNQDVLGTMERVLGIRLRGNAIGTPKFGPKK